MYTIKLYKWTSLENGEFERLGEWEVESEEAFAPMKSHAQQLVKDEKILTPDGIAYQYIMEDEEFAIVDDIWTTRNDLM
jgi:hypothetical protein